MRSELLSASLTLGIVASGCAYDGRMTQQVIHDAGTHTFDAPYDKVFAAAEDTLVAQGFQIDVGEPDFGLIQTTRLEEVRLIGPRFARRYVVRLSRMGDATVVVAEPHILWVYPPEGYLLQPYRSKEVDVSANIRWNIDNPEGGEHLRWRSLFNEIQARL